MTDGSDPGHGDVLVLRALGLGDAVTGIAALRGVRRAWPGRRVVLAAPPTVGGWLRGLGVVDEVLPTAGLAPFTWPGREGRGGRHVAVNLHGGGPESHRLLAATRPAELVGFACAAAGHPGGPDWRADEHEVGRWCRLVRSAGGPCDVEDLRLPSPGARGADVVLHPGAASGSRRWPVQRWAWLARRLARAGHPVLVTGSSAERALCDEVARTAGGARSVRSVAGTLDLPALATLIGRARLLVCGDTGVAHLATAFATPSVLLFGPTPPAWWGPAIDPDRHTVIWHGTSPGDPHAAEVDPALAAVTREEAAAAADALLAGRQGQPLSWRR
ncbi:glycosyltransferase family 9 protein [Georgenia sp. SYP-B2076]|uniref:glycosyltransferase family 9 protein n=1 Tax=Georgenia sp. SYP-B2076 TaxID=2495881 RepID=UPI000F8F302B|nr:glycosyltransferase family 9 protein [Georgenia sp. SYP-B2076]